MPRRIHRPLALGCYLMEQICIIDFGEPFQSLLPLASIGIPEDYLSPEVILEGGASIRLASDLWALGCTLYEISHQKPLFYVINDRDELLAEIVGFFGKLLDKWWGKWEARAEFFDENRKSIRFGGEHEVYTLDIALNHKLEDFEVGSEDKKVLVIPEEEQRLLKDLLIKLFTYTLGNRLGVTEVVQHD
ncbi:hypothetical protein B0O99DRAFT_529742 [Bisporella sp. PMI_857]|nr:hypothetical protein B0O99DRAFT_529742 [Bisporella sp. PMI_857]